VGIEVVSGHLNLI